MEEKLTKPLLTTRQRIYHWIKFLTGRRPQSLALQTAILIAMRTSLPV